MKSPGAKSKGNKKSAGNRRIKEASGNFWVLHKEHEIKKSCVGLKPTGGSNPLLCAKNTGKRRKNSDLALFFRFFLFTEIFNKILLPSSLPLFISLLGIG